MDLVACCFTVIINVVISLAVFLILSSRSIVTVVWLVTSCSKLPCWVLKSSTFCSKFTTYSDKAVTNRNLNFIKYQQNSSFKSIRFRQHLLQSGFINQLSCHNFQMCDFFFQNGSWRMFVESWSRSGWIYRTDKYCLMLRSTDKCHADRISCTSFWWIRLTPPIYSVIWPNLFTSITDTVRLSLQYLRCYILSVILRPGHYFAVRHAFYFFIALVPYLYFRLLSVHN
jgi:hypothetical protein